MSFSKPTQHDKLRKINDALLITNKELSPCPFCYSRPRILYREDYEGQVWSETLKAYQPIFRDNYMASCPKRHCPAHQFNFSENTLEGYKTHREAKLAWEWRSGPAPEQIDIYNNYGSVEEEVRLRTAELVSLYTSVMDKFIESLPKEKHHEWAELVTNMGTDTKWSEYRDLVIDILMDYEWFIKQ